VPGTKRVWSKPLIRGRSSVVERQLPKLCDLASAFLILYKESETPTLFGPGERHRIQEPLESQPAGLPTFGDGFDDVGRNESKSQDPPDVSFAQIACARDLGRVGIFTPADRRRPGSASRHHFGGMLAHALCWLASALIQSESHANDCGGCQVLLRVLWRLLHDVQ
jgi:hypothetical protein